MIPLPWLRKKFRAMPIGFDLAQENLHLLQMEKNRQGEARIRAGISLPYPVAKEELLHAPREFRAFIRQALRAKPFRGRKIVTYLPGSMTKLLHLEYEVAPQDNADEVIVKAVITRLGGQQEDFVVDYLQLRTSDLEAKKRTALVAVAQKKEVLAYLELLNGAGLEVAFLDIGPAALRRLVAALDHEKKYPSLLLINFGRAKSFLTILSGRRLLMDREIDFGENKLTAALSRSLEINEAQALAILYRYGMEIRKSPQLAGPEELEEIAETTREILKPIFFELAENINKALIFMASETRGATVEWIYLLGSIARYPGADRFIGELFSLPVKILHPLAHFPLASKDAVPQDLDPVVSIAMATGLALR